MITGLRAFCRKIDINIISKWLWRILEFAAWVAAIAVFYRIAQQIAGRISINEYNKFIEAVRAAAEPNDKGGSVLGFFVAYMIAILGIPTAYILLLTHRIIKWFAIKDVTNHFKRENELLEQQSNNMVLEVTI